ncbi:MAG: protein kinase, partial [Thermoanaerobaculales bacterium]
MTAEQSRKLAAVWFADIVGYTSLSARNEDAALAVVDVLQSLAQQIVDQHDGKIVKFVGDAVLVVFDSVEAALRSALTLQEQFSQNERVQQHRAALRVGCHLGEVAWARDGDVYGDGINVASRIEGQAGPGQVVVTEVVQQQIKQRPDFNINDLGTRSLKGVQGPQRIFLVTFADDRVVSSRDRAADHPTHIGPYRLIEVLGEGGMGEVWLAEQSEPVKRQVALKLIKLGMDTKQVLARFEAERQSLALMDHRNIARIHDAGATHDGRPYFVMELVRGTPITEYCDSRGLRTRQRIGLFTQVCRAVQHAHQKGVVHRDLKPSNLLVEDSDGGPFVKVIDFGVAKAMGQSAEPSSPHTRMGQLLGTPEYMSPEQADPLNPDIDTRSDIYSLGVVLFELLVGDRPYDVSEAVDLTLVTVIGEVEVPRPSNRLTTLDTAETVVRQRRTTLSDLRRELRGDLDWIVLKAMEKERDRRYETVGEFALDLERSLRNEPVRARPPSKGYRLRKFVRRHRVGVALSGSAVVALVFFGITMAVQAERIRQERDRAERETLKALAVQEFMNSVLMSADPISGLGPEATVIEALDWIVDEFQSSFSDDPEVDAAVRYAAGNVYNRLGRSSDAERQLQRAYETRIELLGSEHPDIAEVLYELAEVQVSRASFDSAAVLFEAALSIREDWLEPNHPRIAASLLRLAWSNMNLGNLDAAEPQLIRALEILRAQPEESATVSEPLDLLGQLYWQRG